MSAQGLTYIGNLFYSFNMNYDMRASSPDLHYPVHHFPGDEDIDREAYADVMFGGYLSSVSTLYGAARGLGLEIDSATFERWKRCGAAAGLIDDFLDEAPNIQVAHAQYQSGLCSILSDSVMPPAPEGTDHKVELAARLLHNSVAELPEVTTNRLLAAAKTIGEIVIHKAESADIIAYAQHLREEARLTSLLVTEIVTDDVRNQSAFPSFESWCAHALEFATLADSARDIWADSKAGRIAVAATLANSLSLAIQAGRPLRALYKPIPSRRASIAGIAARMHFSLLPTKLAMRKYGANT